MIGADMARIDSLRKRAQWMADMNPGVEIRLVKFGNREELEIIEARDIKCKKCGQSPTNVMHTSPFGAHAFEE